MKLPFWITLKTNSDSAPGAPSYFAEVKGWVRWACKLPGMWRFTCYLLHRSLSTKPGGLPKLLEQVIAGTVDTVAGVRARQHPTTVARMQSFAEAVKAQHKEPKP